MREEALRVVLYADRADAGVRDLGPAPRGHEGLGDLGDRAERGVDPALVGVEDGGGDVRGEGAGGGGGEGGGEGVLACWRSRVIAVAILVW